jgi:hypothetical protein
MKTNTQSIRKRVSKCSTPSDCDRLDASLNRLYNNGAITVAELQRFDALLCDRRSAIESRLERGGAQSQLRAAEPTSYLFAPMTHTSQPAALW